MTSREIIWNTLRFKNSERLGHDFPEAYGGTDFAGTGMSPSPDGRPSEGVDEWGAVWENMGTTQLGEVKKFPLTSWDDWEKLSIPDVTLESRFERLAGARQQAGDKFLFGYGVSLYERVHFIRGLENTWMDIYDEPVKLARLLDILVEMNLYVIKRYAAEGVDGYIFPDDWGLQNRLMISPAKWRELWKPRYGRVYQAAHKAGMANFLHSCGHIVDILDDLIEIGLDAIHMDQQENMGLELLGRRFGGRLTFFSGVDIQVGLQRSNEEIRQYCRRMARLLGRPTGGFIPRWYTDPKGAGHRDDAIATMCEEFQTISREMYGKA